LDEAKFQGDKRVDLILTPGARRGARRGGRRAVGVAPGADELADAGVDDADAVAVLRREVAVAGGEVRGGRLTRNAGCARGSGCT
jgi:hypothetical protein